MGGMMGGAGMGAWLVWILVGLAVIAAGGVLVAWPFGTRRGPDAPQIPAGDSPAMRRAKDVLKLRYANGEISREEYLQGTVELDD